MKIKNKHAVGRRPVLASVNEKRLHFIHSGWLWTWPWHRRHLCVVLHHMLLEKEAKPSRDQLHSQIHPHGACISIGKKCSVAATSFIVLCFEIKIVLFLMNPLVDVEVSKLVDWMWDPIMENWETSPELFSTERWCLPMASLLSWPLQPLEAWINKYKLLTEQWKQAIE